MPAFSRGSIWLPGDKQWRMHRVYIHTLAATYHPNITHSSWCFHSEAVAAAASQRRDLRRGESRHRMYVF